MTLSSINKSICLINIPHSKVTRLGACWNCLTIQKQSSLVQVSSDKGRNHKLILVKVSLGVLHTDTTPPQLGHHGPLQCNNIGCMLELFDHPTEVFLGSSEFRQRKKSIFHLWFKWHLSRCIQQFHSIHQSLHCYYDEWVMGIVAQKGRTSLPWWSTGKS